MSSMTNILPYASDWYQYNRRDRVLHKKVLPPRNTYDCIVFKVVTRINIWYIYI